MSPQVLARPITGLTVNSSNYFATYCITYTGVKQSPMQKKRVLS